NGQWHNKHQQHNDQCQGRSQGAILPTVLHKLLVKRPAGQPDNKRRQYGHQKVLQKKQARQRDDQQQPPRDHVSRQEGRGHAVTASMWQLPASCNSPITAACALPSWWNCASTASTVSGRHATNRPPEVWGSHSKARS